MRGVFRNQGFGDVFMYDVLAPRETMEKIREYQTYLEEDGHPGGYFEEQLKSNGGFGGLEVRSYLEKLVNTKRPQIYAESAVSGDGRDWTQEELSILGDISIAVPVTIYDNGRHSTPDVHDPPIQGTLLFVPGALLRNDRGVTPADWNEVTHNGQIDPDGYYRLYERRLLPALMYTIDSAQKRGKQALVTIPCVGCGYFSGKFHHQLGPKFKEVLKRLLDENRRKLEHVQAIYFDPYRECENERFEIGHISLLVRPLTKGNEDKPQLCRPEVYEEEGGDFSDCMLFSVVAWDHVSWPGNDYYNGSRHSDDGVKAAATNSMQAMTGVEGFYDKRSNRYLPPNLYHIWEDVVAEHRLRIEVEDNLVVYD